MFLQNLYDHYSLSHFVAWAMSSSQTTVTVTMNYENCDTNIIIGQKVMIIRWPASVPFASPSKISNIGNMCTLHNAWLSGTACWQQMSRVAVKEHIKEFEARMAAKDFVLKKCKRRSDVGVNKIKTTVVEESDKENKEVQTPPKKTKMTQKRVSAKTQMPPVSQICVEDEAHNGVGDMLGASCSTEL